MGRQNAGIAVIDDSVVVRVGHQTEFVGPEVDRGVDDPLLAVQITFEWGALGVDRQGVAAGVQRRAVRQQPVAPGAVAQIGPITQPYTALAALAGVFLGLTFPFTPVSGMPFLIIALGVVVLGGLGSIVGTFVGGMAFGLAQTLGGHFFGLAAQMLVAYTMVLVVLAVIPRGIFGR